ncbi:MAG: ABC transporter permease subunit, partial [Pseudomonadota bacterium]
MSAAVRIAREEWREWRRSRLAVSALGLFCALLIVVSLLTAADMTQARQDRLHQQAHAEEIFLAQPARHPHRMVHYGHYVFRAPAPLSVFDPGVDAVTGQSIFLEGHRQNAAMFADARAQARAGGFGGLSPAALYHLFLPLLLIAVGHAVFLREREARTLGPLLSQGVTGPQLYAGKGMALLALTALLSVPALIASLSAVALGEPLLTALALYAGQMLYLGVWTGLILLVSAVARSRGVALAVLLAVWFCVALILPRIGVTAVGASLPADGKIVTDMRMKEDARKAGDGHNAADPAFDQLRANLLAEYGVDTVEELPVNFRGVVATAAEARLTDTMNAYADARMQREQAQSDG